VHNDSSPPCGTLIARSSFSAASFKENSALARVRSRARLGRRAALRKRGGHTRQTKH